MASSSYDFRQFQAELAALEGKQNKNDRPVPREKPAKLSKKAAAAERMEQARKEFLTLRQRYELSVADVMAFFPEEEGVAYLQTLLAEPQPRRRRRKSTPAED